MSRNMYSQKPLLGLAGYPSPFVGLYAAWISWTRSRKLLPLTVLPAIESWTADSRLLASREKIEQFLEAQSQDSDRSLAFPCLVRLEITS